MFSFILSLVFSQSAAEEEVFRKPRQEVECSPRSLSPGNSGTIELWKEEAVDGEETSDGKEEEAADGQRRIDGKKKIGGHGVRWELFVFLFMDHVSPDKLISFISGLWRVKVLTGRLAA